MLVLNLSIHVPSMSEVGSQREFVVAVFCGRMKRYRVRIISDDFMNLRNLLSRYLLIEHIECNREQ